MTRENEVAREIVDAAYRVHVRLGPGLFESVNECILTHELRQRGLTVKTQVPIAIQYDQLLIEDAFRADRIVNSGVLIENKFVEAVSKLFEKQTMTYLKLAGLRLGLLINFNVARIKDGITRIANGMPDP